MIGNFLGGKRVGVAIGHPYVTVGGNGNAGTVSIIFDEICDSAT
jgi:hypothetical protein